VPETRTPAQPISKRAYYGFQGTSPWPNGDMPVFREFNGWTLTADPDEATAYNENEDTGGPIGGPFPTQADALAFLNDDDKIAKILAEPATAWTA